MKTAGRAPRRMAPEQRRQQLLDAAIELYGRRPYEQVSIDDIVAEADVSRALFYRYFSGPTEIYTAALRIAADRVIDRFTAPADGPLLDQLRHLLHEFITFADAHHAAFITLMRSGPVVTGADTDAVVDEIRSHAVTEMLTRAGVADPGPLALMTLYGWTSVVMSAVLTWLQERSVPLAELEPWLIDQLVAMLAATAARDPQVAEVLDTLR